MGFSINEPLFLLLIPILFLFTVMITFKNKTGNPFFKQLIILNRTIIIILVVFALAGTGIRKFSDLTTTIFTVDLSASMKGTKENSSSFIQDAIKNKTDKDLFGVVCFGEGATVEKLPSLEGSVSSLDSVVSGDFTNITKGLELAKSIIAEESRKRILLMSDGLENAGEALSQAKLLKEQGIVVDVLPVENKILEEVQISSINIPKHINKNIKYDIEVVAHSLTNTTGKLLLYKNNKLISTDDIEFHGGENKFVFLDVSDLGGGIIYRAEIQPDRDTLTENNRMYGYSYIEDIPNILVVDYKDSASEIMKILQGSKVNVTKSDARTVPRTVDKLNLYDAVVLADISIDDLPEEFPDILEQYVKNTAGGVLVTGGENSYALGGYLKTPLETLLPVDMELKDKKDIPNMGMVIVLDRSGSMTGSNYGISKMELAKESAIRSIDSLNPQDSIGVIAFDDGFHWASPYQQVGTGQEEIKKNIARISPGGGTSILPGLNEAYNQLVNSDTKLKHIILLTDGQAEQSGYDELLDNMKTYGITLSTVAIGSDSDTKLLEALAHFGYGRYYYSDEFTDLPKIFTKETFLAGKSYLNNRSFYPTVGAMSPILSSIESLAQIEGYVSTTKKERADMVLLSDTEEPLLASWQYGLGRSVAFTSDLKGRWTKDLLSSEEGTALLRNSISWILRKQMSGDVNVYSKILGAQTEITVDVPYAEGIEHIEGTVLTPDLTELKLDFKSTAPGIYKSLIDENKEGAYIANFTINKISGTENISTGISVPYSSEFDLRNFDRGQNLLKNIAEITGGKIITDARSVFLPIATNVYGEKDIGNVLLFISLLLFVFDIACRRFLVIARLFEKITLKVYNRIKPNKEEKSIRLVKEKASDKADKRTVNRKKINKEIKKSIDMDGQKGNTANLLVSQKKKRSGR